jgi:hypothetical protein
MLFKQHTRAWAIGSFFGEGFNHYFDAKKARTLLFGLFYMVREINKLILLS